MPHLGWMMLPQSREYIEKQGAEVGGQTTPDDQLPCLEKYPMLPYVWIPQTVYRIPILLSIYIFFTFSVFPLFSRWFHALD